jgi:hypothetical protein
VTFVIAVAPTSNGGWLTLQIDLFDPLSRWQFNRTIAPGHPTHE